MLLTVRRRNSFWSAGIGVAAVLGLAACGSHAPRAVAPSPSSSSPTPKPSVTPAGSISPLTGLRGTTFAHVVAVKVDNVSTGRQTGLNAADVVYCELVEGGLTRLLAVFSSEQPDKVGPVRSARVSDIQLLGQYGRIALAFSGANAGVAASVRNANLQDDAYDFYPALYSFDTTRQSPYRFLVDVAKVNASAPGVAARDVGFRFGAAPASAVQSATPVPGGGVTSLTARYPDTTVSATWDAATKTWLMSRNGVPQLLTDGSRASAANVLVQYVHITGSQYVDHNGVQTPVSATIGSGPAVLFRDGKEYGGTWSRAAMNAPTKWIAARGGSLTLTPGRTWVLLLPVGSALSVS